MLFSLGSLPDAKSGFRARCFECIISNQRASGPVIDDVGTLYFEPDGVAFCDLACLARPCQPATVGVHPPPSRAQAEGENEARFCDWVCVSSPRSAVQYL
jgi:hypothetical protein